MKNIKNRLSESSYSRMVKDDTDVALQTRKIEDLKYLKNAVDNGNMTPELFDFIDVDGSLTAMTGGMPAPSSVSCEALSSMQSLVLEDLIAQEEFVQRSMIVRMWRAFVTWLSDFLSSNSFALRSIRAAKAKLSIRPAETYGDIQSFLSYSVRMFRRDDWYEMVRAVQQLNRICNNIPQKPEELGSWYQTNKPGLETCFQAFGRYIDEADNVIVGSPKFIVQDSTCHILGWRFGSLHNDIVEVEAAMDDEITARRAFNKLEQVFTSGDAADVTTMSTVKKMVIASKQCSLFIGRRMLNFLAQIEKANTRSKYRI